jgi:hypothetical protein
MNTMISVWEKLECSHADANASKMKNNGTEKKKFKVLIVTDMSRKNFLNVTLNNLTQTIPR